MIKELLSTLTPLVESLHSEKRPIFLYGMGDGAEKINAYLAERGVRIAGIVASDAFVRGQSFLNRRVQRISEAEELYGELCLVLCFGLEDDRDEVLTPLVAKGHRIVSPNLPVFGDGCCDFDFMLANAERFERVFDLLADDLSCEIFISLIKYNATGNPAYLEISGADVPPNGFYERRGIHIDVGAYDGDTVSDFIAHSGNYSRIVAFEPDRVSFKKLSANIKDYKNVTAVNKLVGSKNELVRFKHGGGRASHGGEGNDTVECVTVDTYFGFTHIDAKSEPVGSIKIDAEGMDEPVLCGAANTLWCCKSNVCVAVYHRYDDIITLPVLLKNYDYKYKFFLRKKPCLPPWDVFLYAIR